MQQTDAGQGNGLGRPTGGGESPVPEQAEVGEIPEYRRTREIRREAGATTPQG